MNELLAFLLPPATALVGMRIARLIFGKKLEEEFQFGLRFALGMCVGIFVLTQALLFGSVVGLNLCAFLAWTVFAWALIETLILVAKVSAGLKPIRYRLGHIWLLMLIPVVLLLWAYGRLNLVDGVHEFDAGAFWLLKARILYFDHGKEFFKLLHTSNLAYTHMDYPWLVPGLYTLTYGAVGGVDEFVIKTWPFWMIIALCGAIFSLGRVWQKPHPAPILVIVLLCYLPATERFLGQEGGTVPLLFCVTIAALLFVISLMRRSPIALAAGVLALGCCAATKLEGIVYAILWAIPLSLYCWRSRWLRNPTIWKAAVIAACFLIPYGVTRVAKPVPYPESHWLHDAASAPSRVLRRYPQTLFLGIGSRIFHSAFFKWDSPDKEHLHWIGHWQGRETFAGPELSVLPWILLPLLGLTFWKRPTHRLALGALLFVIVGQILALSLIISSLAVMQGDVKQVIDFSVEIMGRYFYPFFTACFLGTMAIWLPGSDSIPAIEKSANAGDAVETSHAVYDHLLNTAPQHRSATHPHMHDIIKSNADIQPCVSVVMPVFNEGATVTEIIKLVLAQPLVKQLIIVDDCSTDNTWENLQAIALTDERISLTRHEVNQGKGAALRTGFASANCPFVIIQDADLEYDPTEYYRLISPLLAGQADVVFGSRFIGSELHRVLYYWHSLGNRFLTTLSNMATNLNLTDMETCYKAFRREVIQKVEIQECRFGFEPEITAKVARMNLRIYEVAISYRGRTYQEGKKIGWRDGVHALWCIVKYNFLSRP